MGVRNKKGDGLEVRITLNDRFWEARKSLENGRKICM